jgi:hypothetical protein
LVVGRWLTPEPACFGQRPKANDGFYTLNHGVDLVRRTSALLAAEADRRQGSVFAGAAAVFACVCVLLTAQILRMLAGDSALFVWLVWVGISSVLGTASAMLLAPRRRFERRIV